MPRNSESDKNLKGVESLYAPLGQTWLATENRKLKTENSMQFRLVDKLVRLEPGQTIVMTKQVHPAEEYLADHFPEFPVLPGVLMLEAAVQAAAWLVREYERFAHSLIVLRSVRGVRYGAFVQPGQVLTIQADTVRLESESSEFKIRGEVGAATAIQGRIELAHRNLADGDPALAGLDKKLIDGMMAQWKQLQIQAGVPYAHDAG